MWISVTFNVGFLLAAPAGYDILHFSDPLLGIFAGCQMHPQNKKERPFLVNFFGVDLDPIAVVRSI